MDGAGRNKIISYSKLTRWFVRLQNPQCHKPTIWQNSTDPSKKRKCVERAGLGSGETKQTKQKPVYP